MTAQELCSSSNSHVNSSFHYSYFCIYNLVFSCKKNLPSFLSVSCSVSLSLPPINSLLYSVDYNCYYITYFDAPIVLELASESPFKLGHSFLLLCLPGNF